MRSYRRERMRELRDGIKDRNEQAKDAVIKSVRFRTPIGTPASTGDPHYQVTAALWRSIDGHADEDGVVVGTNKKYGIYVHQGTYDYAHGYGGWSEAEAAEFDSLTDTGDGPGRGLKGMKPRPYLVNGLLGARPQLSIIYHTPIIGGQ